MPGMTTYPKKPRLWPDEARPDIDALTIMLLPGPSNEKFP